MRAAQRVSSQNPDVDAKRNDIHAIADNLRTVVPEGHAVALRDWKRAKTPWGDPDLQGVYTNVDEWGIPFEPPAEFEGRRLDSITAQEFAQVRASRRDAWILRLASGAPAEPGTIGWYDNLNVKNSRTWLIIDPADGHVPPLTPGGQQRAAAAAETQSRPRGVDSYEDQGAYARCISRGFPGSMIPEAYGDAYQIHQAPGYVAIRYEQIHETRVVPLDGRAHVNPAIRSYMGDARGHWDRETLVVETTNFKPGLSYGPGSLRAAFRGVDSAALRLTERFSASSPTTLEWSVTVDDGSTWIQL